MKGFGMTLLLRDDPDLVARYRAHHLAVWPAVTTRLRAIGIDHMEIFLADRRMFMHFTAPDDFDPSRDFATLVDDPEYQRWDGLMRTFQEPAPEAQPGEWWHPMEEVFDLDWPQHRPGEEAAAGAAEAGSATEDAEGDGR